MCAEHIMYINNDDNNNNVRDGVVVVVVVVVCVYVCVRACVRGWVWGGYTPSVVLPRQSPARVMDVSAITHTPST